MISEENEVITINDYQENSQNLETQSNDIFSHKIKARSRTFFVDLKESHNGYFVKIAEKSRGGRKSTIMMDEEDIQEFIETLQEIQNKIKSNLLP